MALRADSLAEESEPSSSPSQRSRILAPDLRRGRRAGRRQGNRTMTRSLTSCRRIHASRSPSADQSNVVMRPT